MGLIREHEVRDDEGIPMDNWLTILRAVDGILSTAAAMTMLINTLVCVRRDGGRKAKSSKPHLAGVSIRSRFVRGGGRRTRTKEVR
jgi:hypothetical protein